MSADVPWQLRHGTSNRKLGPGAWVVTLGSNSCPTSCRFRGAGCYAENGPMAIHWRRVSRGDAKGTTGRGPESLAEALERVPRGALLRLGDAGDISFGQATVPECIDVAVEKLSRRGVDVIAYSHLEGPLPRWCNRSTERGDIRWSEATVRTYSAPEVIPRDPRIVRCPAEYVDITCDTCRLCARFGRRSVVAFSLHGTGARRARAALNAPD